MKPNVESLLACAALALFAAACQKSPEPKTAPPAAQSSAAGASVAAPPNQMPLSDSAIAPKSASTPTQAGSQANPAPLNKAQEQAGMPYAGQVNNHSVPQSSGDGSAASSAGSSGAR
jgi:hypothetical protein